MNEYIKEGMNSFRANKVKFINPYKKGSKEYNDFERGWTQALKRCPENQFKDIK